MTNRRAHAIERQHLYTLSLTLLLVGLFAAYMYFLSASVVHVVIRKEIRAEINVLNSEVAMLESTYINRQHSVSSDVARQRGYVAVAEKVFLTRADTSLAMSSR